MSNLLFRLKEYLRYLSKAKGRHGLHSPYIYALVDQGLKWKNESAWPSIENLRHGLVRSAESIVVTDLGAGSQTFTSNRRAVSRMTKVSASSRKKGELLARLVHFNQADRILELGTHLGIGSAYLASGGSRPIVTTVEGCNETRELALEHFHSLGIAHRITSIHGSFSDAIAQLKHQRFNLIYLDGHHSEQATNEYMERLVLMLEPGGAIVLDDIYWSPGMKRSWTMLRQDQHFNLSLDFFCVGVLLHRESTREREHFTLLP